MDAAEGGTSRARAGPADRSLRIAVVTETWPPEINGVAATVACVVEGLCARGHAMQLVRPRQGRDDVASTHGRYAELLVSGVPIPRYRQLRMGLPTGSRLVESWTRTRPDVVHVATEGPLGWSAVRAATSLGLPVTSDFRTNFHAYSTHYGIGWLHSAIVAYLRRFHNATATTMVPTEPLRAELASTGFRDVTVVSRGVDARRFDSARRDDALRRAWGAGPDDLVVLGVGRLAPEKNIGALTAAFAAIRATDDRARLVLVGDGPLRERLSRDLPHAVFAGHRRGDDLAAHYASADLFLMPSLTETFGNVTCEAMASGLAVVAYDYAAAAQCITSGTDGLLVPFGDADCFVAAARAIGRDGPRRRDLGAAARRRAVLQDWPTVVAHVEAVLRDAMRKAAVPSRTLAAARASRRRDLDPRGVTNLSSKTRDDPNPPMLPMESR